MTRTLLTLLLVLTAGCAAPRAAAPRYIIYAHGKIVETEGRRPTDPAFGVYEYDAILDTMRRAGFEVLSEQRGPNASSDSAASRIAHQVDSLLTLGVAPEEITIIGFSKGGWIAILASSKLQNPRLGFVFMGACGPWSNDAPDLHVSGRMLSLIETSDTLGVSCAPMFSRKAPNSISRETALSLGLGHGTFFQPRAAWLEPVLAWARGEDQASAARDSGFEGVQARGAVAMGVDQYTSSHVFESLPDGGRIVLQRDSVDSAGAATIRMHLQHIARAFAEGDFALPGFVHAEEVPGTAVMRARRALIRYEFDTLPRGGQVRIQASDSLAVRAIHEFLSFQREDHHAPGHDAHQAR
jgi:dienelactone hydrolase